MEQFTEVIDKLVIPVIVAIIVKYYDYKADKRHQEERNRAEKRIEAEKMNMEMQWAVAKMSYASAMALKRGYANGEVEEGIEAYEKVKSRYNKFINDEYVEHIQE